MFRFFRSTTACIFPRFWRTLVRNCLSLRIFGPSLFSVAITSYSIGLFRGHYESSDKLLSFAPEIDSPAEHLLVRLFRKFASVEVDGEVFMTPRDFVDCVTGARPPLSPKRHVIDARMVERLLAVTPRVSSNHKALFHTLDRAGLISFSEYLFLLSILTHSRHNLYVLFRMFDRDCSGSIEKSEFLQIIKLCNMKLKVGTQTEQTISSCPTTIQRHLFNKDGRGKLAYQDFLKFISGLRTEVLRAEFYRLSSGSDSISPLQLAQAILRYADLPEEVKTQGLEHVAESIMFEKDEIDFESYCAFFNLFFQYEDLYSALKMYMLSHRAISKGKSSFTSILDLVSILGPFILVFFPIAEEFHRAARAVTGKRLNDVIVDTVFLLFDADGDGHLSAEEFISVTRSYLARGTRGRLVDESKVQNFTSCVGTRMHAILL